MNFHTLRPFWDAMTEATVIAVTTHINVRLGLRWREVAFREGEFTKE
jgi:hypothetical protein